MFHSLAVTAGAWFVSETLTVATIASVFVFTATACVWSYRLDANPRLPDGGHSGANVVFFLLVGTPR